MEIRICVDCRRHFELPVRTRAVGRVCDDCWAERVAAQVHSPATRRAIARTLPAADLTGHIRSA